MLQQRLNRWTRAACALVLLAAAIDAAAAQTRAEIVRGSVTSDSGTVIPGADVVVTRVSDAATQTTKTDSGGRYETVWTQGTGTYLVSVSALGFRAFTARAALPAGDSILVVDAKLTRATPRLAPVVSRAQRAVPDRDPDAFNAGASESQTIPLNAARRLPPDQAGDLAAIASMLPGVTPAGGGISVLGLAPGQNITTLNGLAFSGTDIPRDAFTRLRVQASSYDPGNGWFSGAQTAVDLALGTQFTTRSLRLTADAPALQYTDRISARSGQQFTNVNASVGGTGQLVDDRWSYNFGAQGGRRATDPATLLTADADLLEHAGIAPDTAARFLSLIRQLGVPTSLAGIGSSFDDNVSFLGRVDHAPYDWTKGAYNRFTYGVLGYGKWHRLTAPGLSPSSLATHTGTATQATGTLDALATVVFGNNYLADLRSGFTLLHNESRPYLALPDASAWVASALPDQTTSLSALQFGGNSAMASDVHSWRWETKADVQRYAPGSASHRVKLSADARYDQFTQNIATNQLGAYTYNSLADLAANQPATFTRTLVAPTRQGGEWNTFLAAGDLWRVSQRWQVTYGARVDGNAFSSVPAANPALAQALGVRTDVAPASLGISPRLGFTWQPSRGTTVRGGAGEFRNLVDPSLLAAPSAATGLPGSLVRLTCIGAAVPAPDWESFASNPATIPTQCAGGGGAFVDAAPNVQVIDPHYRPQQSWRANLGGTTGLHGNVFSLEGIVSSNLDQPGIVDRNFDGAPRFTTSDEGRPVFVSPSSIVPASGAVSSVESRTNAAFGHVVSAVSDLRSRSRQLVFTLRPALPSFLRPYIGDPSVAYTLTSIRAGERGFDGATFGDPQAVEWARGDLDSRHQFVGQLAVRPLRDARILIFLYGRVLSGLPYTPLVGSDVNGDGLANDRAFIFDPAKTTDLALANSMRSLLASATPTVRNCLMTQLGAPAGRNSCEGPWTANLNASVRLSGEQLLHVPRLDVTLNLANPLGGLDQLLHGDKLHGWGTPALPDPILYTVHGFDAQSDRFLYEVNQRFGSTRTATNLLRAPFRLTLDVSVDVARSIPEQQVERWLRPGRAGHPGARVTAADLVRRLQRTVPDPYAELLAQTDSLLLSDAQVAELRSAEQHYRSVADSMWRATAGDLASLGDRYDLGAVSMEVDRATDDVWELTRTDLQAQLGHILSPAQIAQLSGWAGILMRARDRLHIRLGG